jgi:lipopolysaccharide/colanic/teichoic acid biosynthesis glycosyltransferase
MTGLWQIRARRLNRSIEDMLEHDLEYVRSRTITRDVRILLATVGVVLNGEGAA